MTGDECQFFMTHVLKASDAETRMLIDEATRQGWTLYRKIGPMYISISRVPGRVGSRTMSYQVTVK